ncbi:hypothetical protein BDN72DRAFT_742861, partial [Pluteus cervinus]
QALQAVKAFRTREIKVLPRYIRHHGPLPVQNGSSSAKIPFPSAEDPAAKVQLYNPFLPHKNPKTGKWIEPKYSRRRQAELIKKAKASGTLDLLPPGPRLPRPDLLAAALQHKTAFTPSDSLESQKDQPISMLREELWNAPVDWFGNVKVKQVPGSEVGTRLYAAKKRMFKGHKWERVRAEKGKKRSILLRDMAKRIYNYKAYYRKRRPDPLMPVHTVKAAKLPF